MGGAGAGRWKSCGSPSVLASGGEEVKPHGLSPAPSRISAGGALPLSCLAHARTQDAFRTDALRSRRERVRRLAVEERNARPAEGYVSSPH